VNLPNMPKAANSCDLNTGTAPCAKKPASLMADGKPVGGQWNFDADNRASFGKQGPPSIPAPQRFAPDAITQEVMALVNTQLAHHPGHLTRFGWPVTRDDALLALQGFITQRLPLFGQYQDAMWEGRGVALPLPPARAHSTSNCSIRAKWCKLPLSA
jgi:deoxyribodipyrimidine photolyase-like uncharacterized protein